MSRVGGLGNASVRCYITWTWANFYFFSFFFFFLFFWGRGLIFKLNLIMVGESDG